MLSNVSWGEYGAVVLVLLVVYYVFIGATYYREEIKALLKGKLLKKNKASTQEKSKNSLKETDASFEELEAVVNDLRYAVLDRAGMEANKQELLDRLWERLAPYAGLQRPAYRTAINNYIMTNAKEICGVVFSESELNSAWDKLPR